MGPFKQGGSSRFQDYMIQMIKKIHDAEEMLLSGDDRHLEELKQISDMIDLYVSEGQGQKFEPQQYRNVQGHPQGAQSFFDNRYGDYPMAERSGREGTRGHLGYWPYTYPVYPFYNQDRGGQGGSRQGREGDNYGFQDRPRR
jgi:hypothetical protein